MKNVLFVSFDDLFNVIRFRNAYGEPIQTPNLDRLVSMGTYFDSAHAVVPVCNPSRTSTLTGQSPFHTGVEANGPPFFFETVDPDSTLPSLFQAAGYETASAGKIFHGIVRQGEAASPAAAYLRQIFDVLHPSEGVDNDGREGSRPAPFPSSDFADNEAARWAANYIEGAHEDPWFLAFGFLKPHTPWFVPKRFFDQYDRSDIVLPENLPGDFDDVPLFFQQFLETRDFSNDEWKDRILAYMATISFVDAQLGILLDALDRTEAWDDTTVVVWSDHGYHLGDKEQWGKFTHWEQATNAPLIIVDPDVGTPGTTVRTPVSLMDIFPTIVDLAGIDDPLRRDGHSLLPLLRDPEAEWGHFAGSIFEGSVSLRTERYRYIASVDGSEQLYDMIRDPDQNVNLAAVPGHRVELAWLHDKVARELDRLGGKLDLHDDSLRGTRADDVLFVSPNIETASGGAGDDTYIALSPAAIVEKRGGGRDTIVFYASRDGAAVEAVVPAHVEVIGFGENAGGHLVGSDGRNRISGGAFDDRLEGMAGRDRLSGGPGRDVLKGGRDDDRLDGDKGQDRLSGGQGADLLKGGTGVDRLRGGEGPDLFVYAANAGADLILDFTPGVDQIDLSALRLKGWRGLDWSTREDGSAVVEVAGADVRIVLRTLDRPDLDTDDFIF